MVFLGINSAIDYFKDSAWQLQCNRSQEAILFEKSACLFENTLLAQSYFDNEYFLSNFAVTVGGHRLKNYVVRQQITDHSFTTYDIPHG